MEVSRGDTISVKAYYENATGHGTNSTSVAALAAALTGAYGGLNGGSEAQQLIHDIFNKHAGAALAAGATRNDTHPSAYLNYLMFDTEYNLIASQTGYVGIDGTLPKTEQIINRNNLVVEQAGYVYIYVSNESQSSHYVFFDNLEVSISESPILETTDYYPFGLTFNSYTKSGTVDQRYKYNGKERIGDLDLNWYDYGARMYDATLARWGVVDGASELYFSNSSYNYALNNPINAIDPDGNLVIFINGQGSGGRNYWRSNSVDFDIEVMYKLNDYNAIYVDGSPTNVALDISPFLRWASGFKNAENMVEGIIENLDRDPQGNITESIKIITHSMGGVYAKGFVAAIKSYIRRSKDPQIQKALISLVADFDMWQAGSRYGNADSEIYTQQYINAGVKGMKDLYAYPLVSPR